MRDDGHIIEVDRVSKRYGIPLVTRVRDARWTWRARFGSRPDRPGDVVPWSLRNITFSLRPGETLGVIGRNGAGKSTLLKLLAGVTPPTRGRIEVRGRLFPMIELNAGINLELTGRENVRLLGAVMGIPRRDMEIKLQDIEAFCELEDWFDRPARTYSSGMLARLGFAVAVNVDADVLLIDEVLSVGDFAFQRKCIDRISRFASDGRSVVFVSHNPYQLERMCNRVICLERGGMKELGHPSEVLHHYFNLMTDEREVTAMSCEPPDRRPGTGELRIEAVEVLDATGSPVSQIATDSSMTIRLHYIRRGPQRDSNFGIRIFDPQNTMLMSFESTLDRNKGDLSERGWVDCVVPGVALMPNVYTIQVKVAGDVLHDMVENAARFDVVIDTERMIRCGGKGLVYAASDWRFC